MAVRIEDLSGPRNVNLLQTLSRLDWKHPDKIPHDPMLRLTQEEAKILKEERGETYNGPYRLEEGDIHLGLPRRKTMRLSLLEGSSTPIQQSEASLRPTLVNDEEASVVFSEKYEELIDTGEYYSNGDKF